MAITVFLQIITFVGLLLLFGYVKRKAYNLAQKQDLDELTRIVEKVRSDFSKTKLVHRVQFEAEFRYYEKIWQAVVALYDEVILLMPAPALELARSEQFSKTKTQQIAYSRILADSKPFISAEVWEVLKEFEVLPTQPITGTRGAVFDAAASMEAAREKRNRCADAIRKRLETALVV